MVVIRCSYTAPVNDHSTASADSMVTVHEFFGILQEKSRNPMDFVEDITACTVVREDKRPGGQLKSLTRRIRVTGFAGEFEEHITLKPPTMVRWHLN